MIGGFALVAYPAEYRNSGVMTFIVNHAGTVFQKDLGPNTAKIAERMLVQPRQDLGRKFPIQNRCSDRRLVTGIETVFRNAFTNWHTRGLRNYRLHSPFWVPVCTVTMFNPKLSEDGQRISHA